MSLRTRSGLAPGTEERAALVSGKAELVRIEYLSFKACVDRGTKPAPRGGSAPSTGGVRLVPGGLGLVPGATRLAFGRIEAPAASASTVGYSREGGGGSGISFTPMTEGASEKAYPPSASATDTFSSS